MAARFLLGVLCGLGVWTAAWAAFGQESEEAEKEEDARIDTYQVENDFFADEDRHYTHGTRLAFVPRQKDVDPFFLWLANTMVDVAQLLPGRPVIPQRAEPALRPLVGFALAQEIFIPADVRRPVPDPSDRPYAGWLYGAVSVHALYPEIGRLDSMELSIGVAGPAAAEVLAFGRVSARYQCRIRVPQGAAPRWCDRVDDQRTAGSTAHFRRDLWRTSVGSRSHSSSRRREGGRARQVDRSLAPGSRHRANEWRRVPTWARLMQGKSDQLYEDGMIAATAIVHGLTVATRNVRGFVPFGVPTFNPFGWIEGGASSAGSKVHT